MLEFARTIMGKAFFESTLPRAVKALERIADVLENIPIVHTPTEPPKVLSHLDHVSALEVAYYGPSNGPDGITVECAKCGCVVVELFNKEDDDG